MAIIAMNSVRSWLRKKVTHIYMCLNGCPKFLKIHEWAKSVEIWKKVTLFIANQWLRVAGLSGIVSILFTFESKQNRFPSFTRERDMFVMWMCYAQCIVDSEFHIAYIISAFRRRNI